MNELEYVVGSTEDMRSDVIRYVRHLRSLDERISFHLQCIRLIAEDRERSKGFHITDQSPVSSCCTQEHDADSSEGGVRKRMRLELCAALKESFDSVEPEWCCEQNLCEEYNRSESVTSGGFAVGVPVGSESEEELRLMFTRHKTFVQRHLRERDSVSQELSDIGKRINQIALGQLEPLLRGCKG